MSTEKNSRPGWYVNEDGLVEYREEKSLDHHDMKGLRPATPFEVENYVKISTMDYDIMTLQSQLDTTRLELNSLIKATKEIAEEMSARSEDPDRYTTILRKWGF